MLYVFVSTVQTVFDLYVLYVFVSTIFDGVTALADSALSLPITSFIELTCICVKSFIMIRNACEFAF